jgi:hypothetical protein
LGGGGNFWFLKGIQAPEVALPRVYVCVVKSIEDSPGCGRTPHGGRSAVFKPSVGKAMRFGSLDVLDT